MFAEIEKILQTKFAQAWATRTPIKYPDVAFAVPESQIFVCMNISFGVSVQMSIGRGRKIERQFGVVVIECFGPANTGKRPVKELADYAATALRFKQFKQDGVTIDCQAAQFRDVSSGSKFVQGNVIVDFQADAFFD